MSLSPRLRHQVLPPPDVQAAGDGPWQDALLNDRGRMAAGPPLKGS
ncbi:MAG: hypothetical protein VXY94_12755 [Planctomycetota bacterium]|nr:hypothetical protein [Planctomycetota bacterium]MEC8560933.1 hypothetical protein [Planctomycetota bacterium]MEC8819235.1 hypothetical protein [Planctomycetota bacterium]MED5508373.1 hypothetical protein [Planctomycetota bacterium]